MQARDAEPPVAATARAGEGAADAPLAETIPELTEILGPAEETARGMLEAEEALRLVRQRFEKTEDPELQGELAAEALDHVERQMQLTHERRRQLDSAEAKLWARQNRLEGLSHTHAGKCLVACASQQRARRKGGNRASVVIGRCSQRA
jgi:hypothetical protein